MPPSHLLTFQEMERQQQGRGRQRRHGGKLLRTATHVFLKLGGQPCSHKHSLE